MLRHFLSFPTIALASLCMLFSCGNTEEATSAEINANSANDSTTLRIAILPIEECAPLKYAKETGLDRRMGLNITLIEYNAMMDMDTAVLSDMAHVYFEDSLRIGNIKADSLRPKLLVPVPVRMSLVANNGKGIEKLSSLKTHMVGLTRISALEKWMEVLIDSSHIEQDEVYHAQINSLPVRFRMLNDGLIDAAIMPRPWSDSLAKQGHIVMKEEILDGMGFFISTKAMADKNCRRNAELLKKVYLEAMKQTTE